jgi:hypothetical protein
LNGVGLAQSGPAQKYLATPFRKAEIVLPLSSRLPWRVRAAAEGEKAGGEKQASIIRPVSEIGDFFI